MCWLRGKYLVYWDIPSPTSGLMLLFTVVYFQWTHVKHKTRLIGKHPNGAEFSSMNFLLLALCATVRTAENAVFVSGVPPLLPSTLPPVNLPMFPADQKKANAEPFLAPPAQLTLQLNSQAVANQIEVETIVGPLSVQKTDAVVAALHAAMEGSGTDSASLVTLLTAKTNLQLEQINLRFRQMYGTSLSNGKK